MDSMGEGWLGRDERGGLRKQAKISWDERITMDIGFFFFLAFLSAALEKKRDILGSKLLGGWY